MRSILWIDDDLDDYPAIKLLARRAAAEIVPCYDLSCGDLRLRQHGPPDLLLLDAIVPPRDFQLKAEVRYTGVEFLLGWRELAQRTIMLTIVSEERLRKAGLAPDVVCFNKLDLASRRDEFITAFNERISGRAKGGRE
jgi:hypothetical protein